ncbi:hypothetical protein C7N43_05375 [Sphingobacteriales bacterium UPWRP_1]|nr:hypothetical protein BVG80_09870 [Sphingobacteriales bacterium TSM_CSM]PSJ78133.1 hypothetical protein C7N43_05375 [Sphingobacteriales bacterium UPWRP_1]
MKNVSNAIYAQLIYMVGMGLGLLFFPNLLLGVFGISPATEVWVRVVGALALVLAYYYFTMLRQQNTVFFWATVWGRYAFCLTLAGLVALGFGEKPIYLFAAFELLLAGWAHFALSQSKAG